MRRSLFALVSTFAFVALANPVEAQLKFGAHAAFLTGLDEVTVAGTPPVTYNSINGTLGLGARVMLDPPLLPVALVGSGTYYLTDSADPSYWEGTIAGQLRLPLPVVKPYVTAGWQVRNTEGADAENGLMLGIGVQLDLMVSAFLEGTFEFSDDLVVPGQQDISTSPFVIKLGVLF